MKKFIIVIIICVLQIKLMTPFLYNTGEIRADYNYAAQIQGKTYLIPDNFNPEKYPILAAGIVIGGGIVGFSLAEVLLSLTIIGILASYTIPPLIQDIQNAHFKIAFKSFYSDLNQAVTRIKQDNGGTMVTLNAPCTWGNSLTCYRNLFGAYLSYAKICPTYNGIGKCMEITVLPNGSTYSLDDASVVLANGMNINFAVYYPDCEDNYSVESINHKLCGEIYVDVNGSKKPNFLGKDVFIVHLVRDGILPAGIGEADTCSTNGWTCAYKVLMNKNY